ncbi:MAG: LLM class flavin-dependent oxidoreductase [Thermoplasmata archaeon]
MRWSIFSIVDGFPGETGRGRDRYGELLDLAAAADAFGWQAIWVAEHHFSSAGVCPAPPVLLAALAQRTTRLRLGVMVSVLPFHRPIELAEQYALVDRLSHGRLELGVGSGYLPLEFEGFGIDPSTKRERFESALAQIQAAFQGKAVRSEGDSATPVTINVLPDQRPFPPMTLAVQRREAVPFVARQRLSLALIPYATLGSLEDLAGIIREYRAALPEGAKGHVAAAVHVYAGARADRARSALQRFLDTRRATQSTFYLEKVREDPQHARAEAIEAAGWAVFGPPGEVEERLEAWKSTGVDELLAMVDFGGLPYEDAEGTVRALGGLAAGTR